MNIIEVKNNMLKLSYEEELTLASFIKITEKETSYIAQILHLASSRKGKTAVARIIFNYKAGIHAYDGSVPSIQAYVEPLEDDFFLNLLDKADPILLGKLNHKDNDVVVSAKLLKDKPVICAEKSYQSAQLVENLLRQNEENFRKTVVIDTTGDIRGNKIVASKDFKLPLNKDSIDYVFERGFEDATPENKAFIQDIFSELNEYISTIEFIPFKDFSAVIDYEFKRTQLLQLIILKNRLAEFEKKGVFANESKEFKILEDLLRMSNTLIVDISQLKDSLQAEYIKYVYSAMEKQSTNYYSIVTLNNNNSTQSTLTTLFGAKNIFTSVICPYSYKYLDELKQCSKNMFMFTPLKQQSDFGFYNIFVNKLAEDEFVLYGKSTKFTPLIIKLEEIKDFTVINKYNPEVVDINEVLPTTEEKLENITIVDNTDIIPSISNAVGAGVNEGIAADSSIQTENNEEIIPNDDEENTEVELPIEYNELDELEETEEEIDLEADDETEAPVYDEPSYEYDSESLEIEPEEEEYSETDDYVDESVQDEISYNPIVNDDENLEYSSGEEESFNNNLSSQGYNEQSEEIPTEVHKPEINIKNDFEDIDINIDIADEQIADMLEKIENNMPEYDSDDQVESEDLSFDDDELTDEDLDMIEALGEDLGVGVNIGVETDTPEMDINNEGVNVGVEIDTPEIGIDNVGVNVGVEVDTSEIGIDNVGVNEGVNVEVEANTPEMDINDLAETNISEPIMYQENEDEEPESDVPESYVEEIDDNITADEVPETSYSTETENPDFAEQIDTEPVQSQSFIEEEPDNNEEIINEIEEVPSEINTRPKSITDEILMEEAQKRAEEEANRPDPIEEHIEHPKNDKKLETRDNQTPIVPVYSAEIPDEDIVESDILEQGDRVFHEEFGRGIIEKIISYGERQLYSINFDEVGRKLLDPKISELKKI